jgi:hypothetical protein
LHIAGIFSGQKILKKFSIPHFSSPSQGFFDNYKGGKTTSKRIKVLKKANISNNLVLFQDASTKFQGTNTSNDNTTGAYSDCVLYNREEELAAIKWAEALPSYEGEVNDFVIEEPYSCEAVRAMNALVSIVEHETGSDIVGIGTDISTEANISVLYTSNPTRFRSSFAESKNENLDEFGEQPEYYTCKVEARPALLLWVTQWELETTYYSGGYLSPRGKDLVKRIKGFLESLVKE